MAKIHLSTSVAISKSQLCIPRWTDAIICVSLYKLRWSQTLNKCPFHHFSLMQLCEPLRMIVVEKRWFTVFAQIFFFYVESSRIFCKNFIVYQFSLGRFDRCVAEQFFFLSFYIFLENDFCYLLVFCFTSCSQLYVA